MKKTEAISTTPDIADSAGSSWRRQLSFQNISAIYLFIVLFIVFSILVPGTFLTPGTWLGIFDAESLTVMAAIAVMIPLVAGVFNLAIGAEIAWAVMFVAVMQSRWDVPFWLAIPITLACGALIGLISGLIITRLKIDSFIATLGMSSILLAAKWIISDNRQITGLDEGFREVARAGWVLAYNEAGNPTFKITLPVIAMLIVALIVWYVLERIPVGRRMYAIGYNPDGARLSGVKVERLQIGTLMAGGVIAALAGVLLASKLNSGDPTVGPSMLLPALTAVFLGSTQFKGGRFNVWGTVLALYVLAVGIKGLQLLGASGWVEDLFYGVALLAAVALSRWELTSKRLGAVRRATTFTKAGKARLAEESAESEVPPQLTPTETALKRDGIEDQGDRRR